MGISARRKSITAIELPAKLKKKMTEKTQYPYEKKKLLSCTLVEYILTVEGNLDMISFLGHVSKEASTSLEHSQDITILGPIHCQSLHCKGF